MFNQKLCMTVFSILFITVSVSASGNNDSQNFSQSGKLTYLEGDVFINDSPGSIGDIVKNSDTIETGNNSYCEVIFGTSNVFRLDENTSTVINWKDSDIKLDKGSISVVFTKLEKFLNGEKDFTVSSPSTVAGIRGTVFFMKVEDENNTYLCICNGELLVGGPEEDLDISSDHHKAYRFSKSGNSIKTETAKLLYHDDEKMDSVAEKIHYNIPWDENNYGY